ncbi:DNA cytosine methyltransferase [Planomonospora venezuelensis]|uniref:Cytosine-specific methyltransferase n=1 Tax=Planomonospora venezuelensis TaxID=1999 RepID=A0A841D7C1_PLAVE|nr:DNA cytosine methyltransferase [Planomonospora venezuelensis]MBB5965369.1 DNA (cytosine-5)-methyltransferase 1 [Planomonospora venezuelensis]GIN05136.1 DNA (cytosine-5-)-methyltransferase [Planomonospora venezuelensis]
MHSTGTPVPITVVDLFAGCGGFTQGFHEFRPDGTESLGPVFRSITAVENNPAAAATYAANFGSLRTNPVGPDTRIHVGDIEKWEPTEEDLRAEVIIGGPPCQGFSALNRKKFGLERNRLWEEFVRIVAEIRPKIFVIENVDRFLKSEEFQNLLKIVQPGGLLQNYRLATPPKGEPNDSPAKSSNRYLLNSADYGAIQARRRAMVIGVRMDVCDEKEFHYPAASHAPRPKPKAKRGHPGDQHLFNDSSQPNHWLPVDSVFIESKSMHVQGTELPSRRVRFSEIDDYVPGIFATRELHIGRNPELLSQARYRAIPGGGNRNDLRGKWYTSDGDGSIRIFEKPDPEGVSTPIEYLSTVSWDNHKTGAGDVMGRLRLGEPSVTIRTEFFKPEKGRYLHPTDHRPITHYEAARIQGFPVEFRWCGSKVEIAKQIGNAVPIPLGRAIAEAIYNFLRG